MSLSPQRVDFDTIWEGLRAGVEKIVTLTGVKGMPMMEDIYKLCTAQPKPYSEDLYMHLKKFLEQHVDVLCKELLQRHGTDILVDYKEKWVAYETGTKFINAIFYYLNNNWIRKRLEDSRNKLGGLYAGPSTTTEVYTVLTLALVVWRDHVFNKVNERLRRHLLELITKERDGEMIDSTLVAAVIKSLVTLGAVNKSKQLDIYKENFEVHFLEDTRDYFARESIAFIAANGVSEYMKKAETRIAEEEVRGKKYLDSSSYDKLKRECDSVLIENHKDKLQVECENYLRDDKRQDLQRMYHLLSRVEAGIDPMLDVLQSYVTAYGLTELKSIAEADRRDPTKYVGVLLNVYSKFCEVVKEAFGQDSAFVAALDKAMRKIVNTNAVNKSSTRSPELLAKYTDILLSKGNKSVEADDLDETLNCVLTIFKYVDEKDVFQKFYSKMLARRLIHGTSVSDDAESAMIGGLKQACGYEYTSKLQRMFTDMSLSGEINEKFKDFMETSKELSAGKADFNVLVLTAGSWPLTATAGAYNLPQELESYVANFTAFYNSQHHGRKLNWLYHLSKGELKTFYLRKKYEFHVTNYQMSLLLLFNKADKLTMKEMGDQSGLKEKELQRTLMSLIRARIFKKDPMIKKFSPDDKYFLNPGFKSKRLRYKVSATLQRETPEENKQTHTAVEEDRKLFLQAAIVRIMKARKVSTHANLIQETITQARTRFKPNISMIKKCIEQLIEKDYIARGEGSHYSYVA